MFNKGGWWTRRLSGKAVKGPWSPIIQLQNIIADCLPEVFEMVQTLDFGKMVEGPMAFARGSITFPIAKLLHKPCLDFLPIHIAPDPRRNRNDEEFQEWLSLSNMLAGHHLTHSDDIWLWEDISGTLASISLS